MEHLNTDRVISSSQILTFLCLCSCIYSRDIDSLRKLYEKKMFCFVQYNESNGIPVTLVQLRTALGRFYLLPSCLKF